MISEAHGMCTLKNKYEFIQNFQLTVYSRLGFILLLTDDRRQKAKTDECNQLL